MIDSTCIAKTVLSIVGQLHKNRRPAFLPSVIALQRMVEDVFWASLDKHEGVPLEVRLFFAPAMPGPHTLRLRSETPLSPRTIRTLSPTHAHDGALVVGAGETGDLAIHSILCSSYAVNVSMPRWLAVESRGPGLVSIRIGSTPIVEFVRGTINQLESISHDLSSAAVMLLSAGLFPHDPPGIDLKIALMMLEIGQSIDSNGKGGAIWILPAGHKMSGDLEGLGQIVEQNSELWIPFQQMWDDKTATIVLLNSAGGPSQQWLHEHGRIQFDAAQNWELLRQNAILRTISSLANVDGAIVMNGDPSVLAFGVICNRFSSLATSVLRSNNASRPMEGDEVNASTFGGSRHRSAIDFCAVHAPAAAIVASHDGGLTVFAAKTAGIVIGSRVSVIESDAEVKSSSTPAMSAP